MLLISLVLAGSEQPFERIGDCEVAPIVTHAAYDFVALIYLCKCAGPT
jgi:hypothetical protein